MSPRTYRLSVAMRLLAEARLGRRVNHRFAREVHDYLVIERRRMGVASSDELLLEPAMPIDFVGVPETGESEHGVREPEAAEGDDAAPETSRLKTALVVIRAIASQAPVTPLMLASAVRDVSYHLKATPELHEEFSEMQIGVLAGRRDGFDEMLQSIGQNHAMFLKTMADAQREEA